MLNTYEKEIVIEAIEDKLVILRHCEPTAMRRDKIRDLLNALDKLNDKN